jgi:hypothetical protein
MQPYFFPYIGYFQLMHAVDTFVIYDDVQFSKGGWIQRNRILINGADRWIALPLKSDSHLRNICQRRLADSFHQERTRLLRQIEMAYRRAPHFTATMELVEHCLMFSETDLSLFLLHCLLAIKQHLGITAQILLSSDLPVDRGLKGQERVIAICHTLSSTHYINAIGGLELYERDTFAKHKLQLLFIKSLPIVYEQFDRTAFIPNLSIIDVMMFNSVGQIAQMLNAYDLI